MSERGSIKMKTVLSVAGSDSCAGAGIQADLKTITEHGVYGMTAITAITAQNTLAVKDLMIVNPILLGAQIEACLEDIHCDAVKIGMLPSAEQVEAVAEKLKKYDIKNIVLDPVMISTSGRRLIDESAVLKMEQMLFPLCTVITPNIMEAKNLSGMQISDSAGMEKAAKKLGDKYGCAVLLKGGHSKDKPSDLLYFDGEFTWFEGEKVSTVEVHGTGCMLSSAVASNLAIGLSLKEAVRLAKDYITGKIAGSRKIGHGSNLC